MKTMRFFGVALVATVLSMGFTACSDDDDDNKSNSGGGNGNNGELLTYTTDDISFITTPAGDQMLLTGVSGMNYEDEEFDYDEKGRCISAPSDWGDDFTISYDPYLIEIPRYRNTITYGLWFYASGYLGRAIDRYKYDDETDTETMDCSYDSEGHLTKMSADSEDLGYITATFTWEGGDLTKVVYEGMDDRIYPYNGVITFEYGNVANECLQQTVISETVYDIITMYEYESLGFIGYFGKGTAHLPTHMEWKEEEQDEKYGYTTGTLDYTCEISYTKNSDGTIATETMVEKEIESDGYSYEGSYEYTYSYISVAEAGTRSAVAAPWNDSKEERTLVSHRHRHHDAE